MPLIDADAFARRYVAMWNEPDANARRTVIAELFAPDAVHYTPTREVRGLTQMESRVQDAYEQWVGTGSYLFRAVAGADTHHNAIRLSWEMVTMHTGEVDSVGTDFLTIDAAGRILTDHQFILP